MKFKGRIITTFVLLVVIVAWHSSYFLINTDASVKFFIEEGFLKYDFIYTPLIFPFIWWLGKQYDKATYYSEKDVLTGVYNRRFVTGIFAKVIALMDRTNKRLSISIIDVDDFKEINDKYGHDMGDQVLQHISKTLTDNTRKCDIVARWGGDEFLIIAPSTDKDGVQVVNNRLEYKINKLIAAEDVKISISVGTAVYPDDGNNLRELIKKADNRMYQLKQI